MDLSTGGVTEYSVIELLLALNAVSKQRTGAYRFRKHLIPFWISALTLFGRTDRKLDEAGRLLELGIEQLRGQSGKLSGLLLAAFELNLAHVRLAEDRVADAQALVSEIKTHGVVLLENDTDAAGELAYLEGRVMLANGDRSGGEAQLQDAISLLGQQNPDDYWIIRAARSALSEDEAKRADSKAQLAR